MATDSDSYKKWKAVVPLLYDWFANHNLTWPSLTCRWGPKLDESTYKRKYRIYFSEQTDGTDPQKITVATAEVCKPRVASSETVTNWNEMNKCPYIKVQKTINHPGEVNKLRDIPQHPDLIVTHTDAPELFVWNVDKQLGKGATDKKSQAAAPDMILEGHQENAEYALGISTVHPMVASGGRDKKVLLWDLHDAVTGLLAAGASESRPASSQSSPAKTPKLKERIMLEGHKDIVEDLVFQPGSGDCLASVGDDYNILLWDTRSGKGPVAKVERAHGESDLHCVDWSSLDEYLATGCADGSLKIWDRRKFGAATDVVKTFPMHRKAVLRVEWSPHKAGVLASSGEDCVICVMDLNQKPGRQVESQEIKRIKRAVPQELLFQHVGHRSMVVDFQWNPLEPWTMLSVSDDVSPESGGGTLQMWRINDLIYRPESEVLQELEQHRNWILYGKAGAPAESVPSTEATPIATPGTTPESLKDDHRKPGGESTTFVAEAMETDDVVVATSSAAEGGGLVVDAKPDGATFMTNTQGTVAVTIDAPMQSVQGTLTTPIATGTDALSQVVSRNSGGTPSMDGAKSN
ncbi:unnamed protein product [Ostreobium quekettii]|uniref:Histone-binding protein RBBP4-like N-terminal domain-containing protein n=1 Tax=Ostreobium quekettii TaxID=121088 RepID=A0A8S1IZA3_9CHLO|nr:unnamed protein product [Ostreobium quekettii]|eukprot:evm.model.scf_1254.2 EVM.evm.TU.scf_1254.2   scf_1254:8109-14219(-)